MASVSIIMPAHNAANTIKDAVESVISQVYSDWELLVIDDASTDDTASLAAAYAKNDSRIKLLHTDKSVGKPFYPRNLGIANASGRYIAFLDSDDIWLPTKLERQIPLFETKNVAVVFSYYAKMNEDGRYRGVSISSPVFASYEYMLNGNCIGSLTGMYDTEKCGKIFQKDIHHEDYVMWLEILKRGFFAINTNSVEAVYRESRSSVSANKLKAFKWQWNILRRELNIPFFKAARRFLRYVVGGFLKFIK